MRTTLILPLAAAVALSACGSEPAAEAPTVVDDRKTAEITAAIDDALKPIPGQYSSTIKVVSMEIPGIPASQAEKMSGMLGGSEQTSSFCVTPEEAERGFAESTKKLAKGDCNYERFSATGGKLDAVLACSTPEQGDATMELVGDVRPDGSKLKMTMNGGAPGLGGKMKMVMDVAVQRTGECA